MSEVKLTMESRKRTCGLLFSNIIRPVYYYVALTRKNLRKTVKAKSNPICEFLFIISVHMIHNNLVNNKQFQILNNMLSKLCTAINYRMKSIWLRFGTQRMGFDDQMKKYLFGILCSGAAYQPIIQFQQ